MNAENEKLVVFKWLEGHPHSGVRLIRRNCGVRAERVQEILEAGVKSGELSTSRGQLMNLLYEVIVSCPSPWQDEEPSSPDAATDVAIITSPVDEVGPKVVPVSPIDLGAALAAPGRNAIMTFAEPVLEPTQNVMNENPSCWRPGSRTAAAERCRTWS